MNLLETMLAAQGGGAVRQLAGRFGLDEQQAATAIQALLPALAGGMAHRAQEPAALESLLGALAGGRHEQYLDDPSTLEQQDTVMDGNAILGHILGSKDVSRNVASQASQTTGLDSSLLKQMLPLVAAMAMGALSKQTGQGQAAAAQSGPAGAFDFLAPVLDVNRDGQVGAMDVIGIMGKFFSR
jgi:hypothetical protein